MSWDSHVSSFAGSWAHRNTLNSQLLQWSWPRPQTFGVGMRESSLGLGSIPAECFPVSLSFFSTFSSSAAASRGPHSKGLASVSATQTHTHTHTHARAIQAVFIFISKAAGWWTFEHWEIFIVETTPGMTRKRNQQIVKKGNIDKIRSRWQKWWDSPAYYRIIKYKDCLTEVCVYKCCLKKWIHYVLKNMKTLC